jgi:hypothetical protein
LRKVIILFTQKVKWVRWQMKGSYQDDVYKCVTGRAQTVLNIYSGSANKIKRKKLDCGNVNFDPLVQDKDYSVRRTLA